MFTKLEGRQCLVVGAGPVGEGKIASLLEAEALVTVVAPHATAAVREWAAGGLLRWYARSFEPSDLSGVFLTVVATDSTDINRSVFEEAQRHGVLCNVVDVPDCCDFFYPAVVRRGSLQIAISTSGLSPALAQRIRRELEQRYPIAYSDWLEQVGQERRALLASELDPERRRELLHQSVRAEAFDSFLQNREGETVQRGDA